MNALHKHFDRLRELLPEHADALITQYRADAAADSRDSRQRQIDRRTRWRSKQDQAKEIRELARTYAAQHYGGEWIIGVDTEDLPLDHDDDGDTQIHIQCWQGQRQLELIYRRAEVETITIIRDSDDEEEDDNHS